MKTTPGYEVTHDGRVFSVDSNWRGLGRRELAQSLNSDGYPSVRLMVNGDRKRYAVHKLVARMHIGPQPMPGYEIRHLDGDKLNSHFKNLAWGTRKENAEDRERHGRTSRGDAHSQSVKQGLIDHRRVGLSGIPRWNKGKPWTQARRDAHVK